MFAKQSFILLAAVSACAVAAPAAPAPAPAAAAPALVTVQNEFEYCLKLSEGSTYPEWSHCDEQGVLVFQKPLPVGPLVSRDGKSCLTVYASEPKGFPEFKMAPCIGTAAKPDANQSYVFEWGDDKNMIRSQTNMAVCDNGKNPEGVPLFVACSAAVGGPLCMNEDDGILSPRACSTPGGYKAVVVPFIQLSTKDQFYNAMSKLEEDMPQVDRYFIGSVLRDHNDSKLDFPADASVETMVKQCYDHCVEIGCSSFDVVYNKHLCYFSEGALEEFDSADDLEAAVYYMKDA